MIFDLIFEERVVRCFFALCPRRRCQRKSYWLYWIEGHGCGHYLWKADKAILQPFELDPLKCVGQGYDGASVMSGIHGGVQARMKGAGYRNNTYVHCASHRRLNLVLAATAERHPMIKSFWFDVFVHEWNKAPYTAFLDVQHKRYPNVQASRSLEVERFLRRFDCILDTLSIFENDKDAETSLAVSY